MKSYNISYIYLLCDKFKAIFHIKISETIYIELSFDANITIFHVGLKNKIYLYISLLVYWKTHFSVNIKCEED